MLAAGRDAGVAIAIRADGGADEPLATRAERSTLETSLAATPPLSGSDRPGPRTVLPRLRERVITMAVVEMQRRLTRIAGLLWPNVGVSRRLVNLHCKSQVRSMSTPVPTAQCGHPGARSRHRVTHPTPSDRIRVPRAHGLRLRWTGFDRWHIRPHRVSQTLAGHLPIRSTPSRTPIRSSGGRLWRSTPR